MKESACLTLEFVFLEIFFEIFWVSFLILVVFFFLEEESSSIELESLRLLVEIEDTGFQSEPDDVMESQEL